MEEEFATYEQALALKELGFKEPCIGWGTLQYEDIIHIGNRFKVHLEKNLPTRPFGIPLKQQVFRWFREKYDLIGLIHIGSQEFSFSVNKDGHRITPLKEYLNYNGTYEEAESACIDKLIELAKQQTK